MKKIICPICYKEVCISAMIYSGPYVDGTNYGSDAYVYIDNLKARNCRRVTYTGSYLIECEECKLKITSEFKFKRASKASRINLIRRWESLFSVVK